MERLIVSTGIGVPGMADFFPDLSHIFQVYIMDSTQILIQDSTSRPEK